MVDLLHLKSEVFKFLLLLCEGVYFVFLCVVGNDTESQDASEKPMGSLCQAGPSSRRKSSRSLRVCPSARLLFGWGLCSGLPPPQPPKAAGQAVVPAG